MIQVGSTLYGDRHGDRFGYSLSLNGNGTVLVVGSPSASHEGDLSGLVRVFRLESNEWQQLGQDIGDSSTGDAMGHDVSVSLDGLMVATSAYVANGAPGIDCGVVRVYTFVNQTWSLCGQPIFGGAAFDYLGHSISLSGNGSVLAVGATAYESFDKAGYVNVYQLRRVE